MLGEGGGGACGFWGKGLGGRVGVGAQAGVEFGSESGYFTLGVCVGKGGRSPDPNLSPPLDTSTTPPSSTLARNASTAVWLLSSGGSTSTPALRYVDRGVPACVVPH